MAYNQQMDDGFLQDIPDPPVRECYLLVLDQADGYRELVICPTCKHKAILPLLREDESSDVVNCQLCGKVL